MIPCAAVKPTCSVKNHPLPRLVGTARTQASRSTSAHAGIECYALARLSKLATVYHQLRLELEQRAIAALAAKGTVSIWSHNEQAEDICTPLATMCTVPGCAPDHARVLTTYTTL